MGQPISTMEHFGSRSDRAGPVSEAEVNHSDVFIGIYAFRYGHVPDEELGIRGASITEREFDSARAVGLRCLCYFADDSVANELTSGLSGEPEWKQDKLRGFKARIDKALVRASFTSPDDLKAKVGADLNRLLAGEPLGYSYDQIRREWERYRRDELATLNIETENRPLDLLQSPLAKIWASFILRTLGDRWTSYFGPVSLITDRIHAADGVLVIERHHPIVEDLGRGDWGLSVIQFCKGDFGIGVDHGLQIDPTHPLQGADIEGVLGRNSLGIRSRTRHALPCRPWPSRERRSAPR
jgi:hypothetical protein